MNARLQMARKTDTMVSKRKKKIGRFFTSGHPLHILELDFELIWSIMKVIKIPSIITRTIIVKTIMVPTHSNELLKVVVVIITAVKDNINSKYYLTIEFYKIPLII